MKPFENVPVVYTPDFIGSGYNDIFFKRLWSELDWVRHDKVPRREYYFSAQGHDYAYGIQSYARTYKSQPSHLAIDWMTLKLWETMFNPKRVHHFKYDTVFLNGYEDASDSLGWHSDNSPEMDDNYAIAIISLGAEREIWFREIPTQDNPTPEISKLKLAHGSLCLMGAGMQDTHQHRIPKSDRVCGPRISLTFRMYTDPDGA